ncbi:MAG: hypothetical protein GC150_07615 [Rhizobiales bacterium]|nr:hypothetical protein [Hyphomicrobiales bacterium]
MRYPCSVILFVCTSIAATADAGGDRERFHGAWGTAAQCARAPIKPGGTVLAEPFVVGSEWLRHGEIWCRLTWFPLERREEGWFTGAQAQCGEDAVRDYVLGMTLSGEELTLRWNFPLVGPLTRCPVTPAAGVLQGP